MCLVLFAAEAPLHIPCLSLRLLPACLEVGLVEGAEEGRPVLQAAAVVVAEGEEAWM